MTSGKATYWLAVGVLALLAGNSFLARHGADLQSLARRSRVMAEVVSGHASGSLDSAEMVFDQGATHFDRAQNALACAQTRLATVQASLARHQGAFAKIQVEHAREVAMEELSRERIRIVVPQVHVMPDKGTI
jgi:hypothetical protein